ncbi:hypothetical protein [Sphingobium sp. YG1]|uniref:hypothetical protein n=1 Tax=Sphingobium sp. YG1 TaxID=2082188 RepID=UPI000DBB0F80|nr:hypothetical protein [Sphingobium sp. YG1]BBC99095.1 hypothetical protein YGS_C1P0351 [Sphingobium sp. YG1]
MTLDVTPARPSDLLRIERHPDQMVQLGLSGPIQSQDALVMCGVGEDGDWGEAWACRWNGRLVACLGLRVTLGGSHVIAWAIMAMGIGAAHLAVTRFARSRVERGAYGRIEAVASAPDVEALISNVGPLDAQQLIEVVMLAPTPEIRFAMLAGLAPAHVLRRYGAASQTHMLMERIA